MVSVFPASIHRHCLESPRTLMCDPDRSSTAFPYTTRFSGIMSPSARTWKSGAVSGSICSHFFESSYVSDLCRVSSLGSKILHTEAHCQFCIHLKSHEVKRLFLVPYPVTALSHLTPVICAPDACMAVISYTQRALFSSVSICRLIYIRGCFWFP